MPGTEWTRIRLIVGLGNPGTEYESSRHNIGFMLIDRFLERMPKGFEKIHSCSSFHWHGNYAGKSLVLQKPMTYMNLSGEAVSALMRSEQLTPEEILVVYDDMDLPLGKLRIRTSGGCGGHNGIRSIIECLGTEAFPRMRIGIGKMANGKGSADFVLSHFSEEEQTVCDKVFSAAADALILGLRRGIAMAMNQFNSLDFTPETAKKTDEINMTETTSKI